MTSPRSELEEIKNRIPPLYSIAVPVAVGLVVTELRYLCERVIAENERLREALVEAAEAGRVARTALTAPPGPDEEKEG